MSDLIFALAVVLYLVEAGASPTQLIVVAVVFAFFEPIVATIAGAHYDVLKEQIFNQSEHVDTRQER